MQILIPIRLEFSLRWMDALVNLHFTLDQSYLSSCLVLQNWSRFCDTMVINQQMSGRKRGIISPPI